MHVRSGRLIDRAVIGSQRLIPRGITRRVLRPVHPEHIARGRAHQLFAERGNGAAQFASFLRQEQAQAVVAKGGIGLAETLFQAMARAESHER